MLVPFNFGFSSNSSCETELLEWKWSLHGPAQEGDAGILHALNQRPLQEHSASFLTTSTFVGRSNR